MIEAAQRPPKRVGRLPRVLRAQAGRSSSSGPTWLSARAAGDRLEARRCRALGGVDPVRDPQERRPSARVADMSLRFLEKRL